MFDSIRTDRLLIRPFRADDAPALASRRSDPEVAEYQSWPTPFTIERAEELVSALGAMDGPKNDEWWMAVVCDSETGQALGEVSV